MRIDIPEKELNNAVKMLRMMECMDFPEISDSNKMDEIYQLITFAENFGITLSEAMEE